MEVSAVTPKPSLWRCGILPPGDLLLLQVLGLETGQRIMASHRGGRPQPPAPPLWFCFDDVE